MLTPNLRHSVARGNTPGSASRMRLQAAMMSGMIPRQQVSMGPQASTQWAQARRGMSRPGMPPPLRQLHMAKSGMGPPGMMNEFSPRQYLMSLMMQARMQRPGIYYGG